MPSRIEIIEADITRLDVDAIVNSTLINLFDGPGINEKIHHAAGPKLRDECTHIGDCSVGEACITRGYDLPARFIIHAVGPIWGGGELNEDQALKNCYRSALSFILEYEIKSIAFSALACGPQNFPKQRAAIIAMEEIIHYLNENMALQQIILCCEDEAMARIYEIAYDETYNTAYDST